MNGTPAPAEATLHAYQRLKSQRHFKRVYQRGRRAGGQWMTLVACFGRPPLRYEEVKAPAGRTTARLGLSVSKDHGGAVRRNKLKRLLREAFRLERHRLPLGLDLVLIPRQRAEDFPLQALRAELVPLVERALQGKGHDRRPRQP